MSDILHFTQNFLLIVSLKAVAMRLLTMTVLFSHTVSKYSSAWRMCDSVFELYA